MRHFKKILNCHVRKNNDKELSFNADGGLMTNTTAQKPNQNKSSLDNSKLNVNEDQYNYMEPREFIQQPMYHNQMNDINMTDNPSYGVHRNMESNNKVEDDPAYVGGCLLEYTVQVEDDPIHVYWPHCTGKDIKVENAFSCSQDYLKDTEDDPAYWPNCTEKVIKVENNSSYDPKVTSQVEDDPSYCLKNNIIQAS